MSVQSKKCLGCDELISLPTDKNFCSKNCYYKNRYWSNKDVLKEINCAFCGELFLPTRKSHKCCSKECSKKLQYSKNIEKVREQSKNNYLKKKEFDPQFYIEPNKKSRRKNQKWQNMKKRFGMTKEDYFSLLDSQNYKCRICNDTLKLDKTTHIDHCHETGKVRGILCHSCNVGLGNFKDSIQNLYNAIHYLEQNK